MDTEQSETNQPQSLTAVEPLILDLASGLDIDEQELNEFTVEQINQLKRINTQLNATKPTPEPPQQSTPYPYEEASDLYTLVWGDTLSGLAVKFNTSCKALSELNNKPITDTDWIYAGNTIKIPLGANDPKPADDVSCEDKPEKKQAQTKQPDQAAPLKSSQPSQKRKKSQYLNKLLKLTDQKRLAKGKNGEQQADQDKNSPKCKTRIYTDILYIPDHPESGERIFMLLNKVGSEQIQKESEICLAALNQPNSAKRLEGLNKLGLLDPFKTFTHEYFLGKKSKKELKNYQLAMRLKTAFDYQQQSPDRFAVLDKDYPELGIEDAVREKEVIDKRYQDNLTLADNNANYQYATSYIPLDKAELILATPQGRKKIYLKQYEKELKALQAQQAKDIDDKIKDYEKEAKDYAKKITIKKGAYQYQYSTEGYYTDSNQIELIKNITRLIKARQNLKMQHSLAPAKMTGSTKLLELEKTYQTYQTWKKTFDPVLQVFAKNNVSVQYYDGRLYANNPAIQSGAFRQIDQALAALDKKTLKDFIDLSYNRNQHNFFVPVYAMNQCGTLLKEQALSETELFAGKDAIINLQKTLKKDPSLRSLKDQLDQLDQGPNAIASLGFYPAYLLQSLLIKESGERMNDFMYLIGEQGKGSQYGSYIKELVSYIEKVDNRRRALQRQAEHLVKSLTAAPSQPVTPPKPELSAADQVHNQNAAECAQVEPAPEAQGSVLPFYRNPDKTSPLELFWDETPMKPANRENSLYPKGEYNRVFVVECSLASQPGKTFFIRSNHGLITKNTYKSKAEDGTASIGYSKKYLNPEPIIAAFSSLKKTQSLGSQSLGDASPSEPEGQTPEPSAKEKTIEFFQDASLSAMGLAVDEAQKGKPGLAKDQSSHAVCQVQIDTQVLSADDIILWASHKEFLGGKAGWQTQGEAQWMRFVSQASGNAAPKLDLQEGLTHQGEYKIAMDLASAKQNFKVTYPNKSGINWQMGYIDQNYEDNKHQTPPPKLPQVDIGLGQMIIEASLYGALSASVSLASHIKVGPNKEGILGLAGQVPAMMDRNDTRTTGSNLIGQQDLIQADGQIQGDVFAGLEVGGKVRCQVNWCPPATHSKKTTSEKKNPNPKFINLVDTSYQGAVTLGLGAGGLIKIGLENNRIIFAISMKIAMGSGYSGSASFALNPDAVMDFISTILEIRKKPGFKRYALFDEADNGFSYQAFNRMLHVSLTFGLSVAQVYLLPWSLVKKLSDAALAKENSGYVGTFISHEDYLEKNQIWIEKTTDVVVTNLLKVLINYHSIASASDKALVEEKKKEKTETETKANSSEGSALFEGIEDIEGEKKPKENEIVKTYKDKAALTNQNQRKAILNILQWIGGDKDNPSQEESKRFEDALKRLHLGFNSKINSGSWEQYPKNIAKLIEFFEEGLEDKELSHTPSFDDNKQDYVERINGGLAALKKYLDNLTQNHPIYFKQDYLKQRRGRHQIHQRLVTDYQVQRLDQTPQSLKKQGYKLLKYKEIKQL